MTAGLRRPSSTRLLADRLTEATVAALGTAEVEVIEVRDHAHDLVNHLVSGYPSETLAPALDAVFFEVLAEDALRDKPVLMAATGGTARHALVLEHAVRPLFTYLHADVVPTSVFAAPEDWGGAASPDLLGERVSRAAAELAERMKNRGEPAPRDPYAPVPFESLLPRASTE